MGLGHGAPKRAGGLILFQFYRCSGRILASCMQYLRPESRQCMAHVSATDVLILCVHILE